MASNNMNIGILKAGDGMTVRLLPNINDNGIKCSPLLCVSSMFYRDSDNTFVVNDDLDFPLLKKVHHIQKSVKPSNEEIKIHVSDRYYCYVLDDKLEIKILRFGRRLFDIISDELVRNPHILDPEFGRALVITTHITDPHYHFPNFENSIFINIEPINIGEGYDSVREYLLNNREISIEKYIKKTSWYGNDKHRVDVINAMLKLDAGEFEYLKKFMRYDKINELLDESE